MNNLTMMADHLADIMQRLIGCRALVHILSETEGTSPIARDALSGIYDLLDCICRDFQADIDCAELQAEKEAGA